MEKIINVKIDEFGLTAVVEGYGALKGCHERRKAVVGILDVVLKREDVQFISYASEWIQTDINSVHRGEELPEGGRGLGLTSGIIMERVVDDPGWWEYHWEPSEDGSLTKKELARVVNAGRAAASHAVRKGAEKGFLHFRDVTRALKRASVKEFKKILRSR